MCEVHVNCWQHECLHGATCLPDKQTDYQCICPIGWKGDRCETGNFSFDYILRIIRLSFVIYAKFSPKHIMLITRGHAPYSTNLQELLYYSPWPQSAWLTANHQQKYALAVKR